MQEVLASTHAENQRFSSIKMADKEKQERQEKKEFKEKKSVERETPSAETLIRILSTDIPGNLRVYAGLTKIKGVSWAVSNAVCLSLKIDKNKKVSDLTEKEFERITAFLKSPKIPEWLLNRRKDEETGVSKHLLTSELDLAKEFDIRKMKKIKSYKGWRHALGQPVRGQRTRSHFRKGASVGVLKTKSQKAATAMAAEKKKEK